MSNCPKCGFLKSDNSESCLKCGVIFSKIREMPHGEILYGTSDAMTSQAQTQQKTSLTTRKIAFAAVLFLGILFQVQKFHATPKLENKPITMVSEDGYDRITVTTDSYGHKLVITEPLIKPMNEEERKAIQRRREREENAASERQAAELARRTPEEKEKAQEEARKWVKERTEVADQQRLQRGY